METLNYEEATPEDVPKLLALLVAEVQGLRQELRDRDRRNDKRRDIIARAYGGS